VSGPFHNCFCVLMNFRCIIQNKSAKIWAFLLAAFWVSFVTFYVLWKSYKRVSALRIREQTSAKVQPEQFAVLVRDIPKPEVHQTRSEQVDSYFRKLHPGTYEKCLVACDISKVSFAFTLHCTKEVDLTNRSLGKYRFQDSHIWYNR
jgi:hypothetical protein